MPARLRILAPAQTPISTGTFLLEMSQRRPISLTEGPGYQMRACHMYLTWHLFSTRFSCVCMAPATRTVTTERSEWAHVSSHVARHIHRTLPRRRVTIVPVIPVGASACMGYQIVLEQRTMSKLRSHVLMQHMNTRIQALLSWDWQKNVRPFDRMSSWPLFGPASRGGTRHTKYRTLTRRGRPSTVSPNDSAFAKCRSMWTPYLTTSTPPHVAGISQMMQDRGGIVRSVPYSYVHLAGATRLSVFSVHKGPVAIDLAPSQSR